MKMKITDAMIKRAMIKQIPELAKPRFSGEWRTEIYAKLKRFSKLVESLELDTPNPSSIAKIKRMLELRNVIAPFLQSIGVTIQSKAFGDAIAHRIYGILYSFNELGKLAPMVARALRDTDVWDGKQKVISEYNRNVFSLAEKLGFLAEKVRYPNL